MSEGYGQPGWLRPGDTCPRCGQPISFVERRVIRGHVYYAMHVAIVDGRKMFRKCSLGLSSTPTSLGSTQTWAYRSRA